MTLKHIRACFFLSLSRLPMKGQWRVFFIKKSGVQVRSKRLFVGDGVIFDTVYPENIVIDNHVHITTGCLLLTHYLDTTSEGVKWQKGVIHIGDGAFIGARTIIAKPCSIGRNAIVGSGSVVTKDIPADEIWAGNPAKFIKKRQ